MSNALSIRPEQTQSIVHRSSDFLPCMSIDEAIGRRNLIVQFTQKVMVSGTDFGAIPGTDKPTLLKAGAEKLATLFGLTPRFVILERTEDWIGSEHAGEPFFYYLYRAQLYRGDSLIAEADGSANSWEKKHRWRWVPETALPAGIDKASLRSRGGTIREPAFAVDKAETSGRYGKPQAHWDRFRTAIQNGAARDVKIPKKDGGTMDGWEIDGTEYRLSNDDPADLVNTIQKMGQKRALVAATLLAVNASEFFTQDIEDMDLIDLVHPVPVQPTASAQQKPAPTDAPQETEADFVQMFAQAVCERPGGTEEKATRLLEGLCKQRKTALGSIPGEIRAQWLTKACDGTYDKYFAPPATEAAAVGAA